MKKLTCIFLILAMAFTAAACTYQQPATAPEEGVAAAEEGAATAVAQKLTITETSIPTIDPQQFNSADSYVPMKGICEGLIRTSFNDINPGVAERWEIAEDNMKMTFHLRDGACWSDGSPLTANDFVYSFRRLADPNKGFS